MCARVFRGGRGWGASTIRRVGPRTHPPKNDFLTQNLAQEKSNLNKRPPRDPPKAPPPPLRPKGKQPNTEALCKPPPHAK